MGPAEVLAWLESRRPAPPAILRHRLRRAVEGASEPTAEAGSDFLLALGAATLRATAEGGSSPRTDTVRGSADALALDLLAADAFLTYAVEAAAEEGRDLDRFAARMLEAISGC